MKTISIKIEEELLKKLDSQAKRLKLPRSVIIRAATEEYIKKITKVKSLMEYLSTVEEVEPYPDEIEAIEEYKRQKKEGTLKTYSLDEVKKMLPDND